MENLKDIISPYTRGLIIGWHADEASWRRGQFFGDDEDNFWPLVYQAFGKEYDTPDYKQKLYFLRHHRIGLCYAESYVEYPLTDDEWYMPRHPEPRKFGRIWQKFPNIKCLFFNGFDANRSFNVYNENLRLGREVYYLPSSDKDDKSMYLSEKKKIWREFLRMTPQYNEWDNIAVHKDLKNML